MKRTAIAILGIAGLVFSGCGAQVQHKTTAPSSSSPVAGRDMRWKNPPAMAINPKAQYDAVVKTTKGSFTISLFAQQDPRSVNNFVFLANHHFFDGDLFFRVIQPFMIQTGDPLNNGRGGPGYQWKGELPPPFPYAKGIVAMANANNPDTNGSQFFICTGSECQSLNQTPTYTEVGRVTKGMGVVEAIAAGKVVVNPAMNEKSKPVHPVKILSVDIQKH